MPAFEDSVRPFQLPQSANGQLYLSQYGIVSQPLILVTPGFGGAAGGGFPPIMTANASVSFKITFYMDQAANELSAAEG